MQMIEFEVAAVRAVADAIRRVQARIAGRRLPPLVRARGFRAFSIAPRCRMHVAPDAATAIVADCGARPRLVLRVLRRLAAVETWIDRATTAAHKEHAGRLRACSAARQEILARASEATLAARGTPGSDDLAVAQGPARPLCP